MSEQVGAGNSKWILKITPMGYIAILEQETGNLIYGCLKTFKSQTICEQIIREHNSHAAMVEALEAWQAYEKECANKIAPDYGYRGTLRDIASKKTESALAKAREI